MSLEAKMFDHILCNHLARYTKEFINDKAIPLWQNDAETFHFKTYAKQKQWLQSSTIQLYVQGLLWTISTDSFTWRTADAKFGNRITVCPVCAIFLLLNVASAVFFKQMCFWNVSVFLKCFQWKLLNNRPNTTIVASLYSLTVEFPNTNTTQHVSDVALISVSGCIDWPIYCYCSRCCAFSENTYGPMTYGANIWHMYYLWSTT